MTGRTGFFVVLAIISFAMFLCAGAVTVGYLYVSRALHTGMTAPPALAHPGVVTGSGVLDKSVLLTDTAVGTVTQLVRTPAAATGLAVVGTNGAVFVDSALAVQSRVTIASEMGRVELIDVEGDGTWEFINRGKGWSDTTLLDNTGRVRWTFGGMPGVNDMVAGDLDGDRIADFVVGMNGDGGVRRLDRSGKPVWQQVDGNVWHVELVDTDGDGTLEIVHSNAAGQLTIRDQTGTVLRSAKPRSYLSHFSICRWPNAAGQPHILLADENAALILDFAGTTVAKFDAPAASRLGEARGTLVRLRDNEPECFTVAIEYDNWNKSAIYIFDQHQALLYQEVITDLCGSVLAIPREGSIAEDLLVGGTGTVWKYSAPRKPSTETPAKE